MFGAFIRALAVALVLFPALAAAQSPVRGFPPGTFQSRAPLDASGGGGSYTGPGDLSVSYSFYYGLRAYSSATRGNKLVNVCDITGGTINGSCVDLVSNASTGQLVSQSGIGTNSVTCPGANCGIKIYYDLTGGNNCASASCDATQSTVASMDTLGTSCSPLSVSVCATSTGGRYITANNFTISAAPIFLSGVVSVTDTGNQQAVIGNNGAVSQIFFWRNAGTHALGVTGNGGGAILWSGAYTNGYHSAAGLANAASSYIVLDSTVTTGSAAVNTSQVAVIDIHGDSFSDNLASGGVFLEGGGALSAPASATAQSINSNAKTFWGF